MRDKAIASCERISRKWTRVDTCAIYFEMNTKSETLNLALHPWNALRCTLLSWNLCQFVVRYQRWNTCFKIFHYFPTLTLLSLIYISDHVDHKKYKIEENSRLVSIWIHWYGSMLVICIVRNRRVDDPCVATCFDVNRGL